MRWCFQERNALPDTAGGVAAGASRREGVGAMDYDSSFPLAPPIPHA